LSQEIIFFASFSILIIGILIFDLTVVGRKSHVISFKESLIWTSIWVSLALGFYFLLLFHGDKLHGINDLSQLKAVQQSYAPHVKLPDIGFEDALKLYRENMAMEFITGYLIEYTLSIDNVFVIMMILSAFSVKEAYYKRILFWGILGAIVLRFIFIFVGSALIHRFGWILLIFGAFLIFSGIKMFLDRNKEEKIEPQKHWLVLLLSKYFRVFPRYVKTNFFVKKKNILYITPLFVVLILIEFTDLIFALDSIPAIFAVTLDPYIVFFSNIFAIIGLRSLFFLLIKVVNYFHYLKVGISALLVFVGIKLLAHSWLESLGFQTKHSLFIILGVIVLSIGLSIIFPDKKKQIAA
jgi:tellurite resistance protein TerC